MVVGAELFENVVTTVMRTDPYVSWKFSARGCLVSIRPPLERYTHPRGFEMFDGTWSRDHSTLYVCPTVQTTPAVGYVIFGTQMSLAVKLAGAAKTAVEAERRTARAVENFMWVDSAFRARYERRVGGASSCVLSRVKKESKWKHCILLHPRTWPHDTLSKILQEHASHRTLECGPLGILRTQMKHPPPSKPGQSRTSR